MEILYIILGVVLVVLFFLNIRSAADILCRTVGGIGALIIYNTVFSAFSSVGVNLISGFTVGLLGLPGGLLIICLERFL